MSNWNVADVAGRPADPASRKGGRNLWLATGVGLGLLIVTLGAAYFSSAVFALIIYGLCLASFPEWKRALARQGRVISLTPIIAGTIGMGISTWFDGREGLVVALLVASGGTIAWRLVDEWVENTLHDALASILTLVWIPFLASFFLLLIQADDGYIRVFIVIAAVAGNDTGGLFMGMLFGHNKMAPHISPKKTWEGAVGGFLVGTALAAAVSWYFFEGDWVTGAIVGAAATVAAIMGDLVESALKRDIEIKDMGSIIPGHGGILDRMDSMLLAAPVAYAVFAVLKGTIG